MNISLSDMPKLCASYSRDEWMDRVNLLMDFADKLGLGFVGEGEDVGYVITISRDYYDEEEIGRAHV